MHRAVRAIAGGAAGMAIMTLILLIGEAEVRFQLGVPQAISRFVGTPGQTLLGFLLFFAVGIIAWPLLFVALERYLSRVPGGDDPAIRGMVFAVLLWVSFVILGSGGLTGTILVLYLAFTFIAHLAYGFTLGAVYERLSIRRWQSS